MHTNMHAHTCVYMHTHLQVTEKLMEAEEKKLRVLKAEIEASKHSDTAGDTEKVHTCTQHTPASFSDLSSEQGSLGTRLHNTHIYKHPRMKLICAYVCMH